MPDNPLTDAYLKNLEDSDSPAGGSSEITEEGGVRVRWGGLRIHTFDNGRQERYYAIEVFHEPTAEWWDQILVKRSEERAKQVLAILSAALSPAGGSGPCQIDHFNSGVCSRGTRSCVVEHEPAAGGSGADRLAEAAEAVLGLYDEFDTLRTSDALSRFHGSLIVLREALAAYRSSAGEGEAWERALRDVAGILIDSSEPAEDRVKEALVRCRSSFDRKAGEPDA
jgi:hypothetical protein